jgi:hypothetical protein
MAVVALLTALQPPDNLVVNAMHRGGQVLVSELGCTVAKLFHPFGYGAPVGWLYKSSSTSLTACAPNARNNDKRKLRGFADAELDRKRVVLKSLEEQMKWNRFAYWLATINNTKSGFAKINWRQTKPSSVIVARILMV